MHAKKLNMQKLQSKTIKNPKFQRISKAEKTEFRTDKIEREKNKQRVKMN